MKPQKKNYEKHLIELKEKDKEFTLIIDGKDVPYQKLDDGSYVLAAYAYDPSNDLVELAQKFIDYRKTVAKVKEAKKVKDSKKKGGES